LFELLCLVSAGTVVMGASPPDDPRGASQLRLKCTVNDKGLSSNCRFYQPIVGDSERLKAGTELGWLDAHPFPISGAAPGAEVKVLVRLNVKPAEGAKRFEVTAPEGAFISASGPPIENPVWIHNPHDSWADAHIPERAARLGQAGEVTARCVATAAGALVGCWIEKENPADQDFGETVLNILQAARMQPLTTSGAPVAGRPYIQTFRYKGWRPPNRSAAFSPKWER